MEQHAFLAPSFAHIWAYCAGAPAMAAMVTDNKLNTEETIEGKAAHHVAALLLEDCRQGMFGRLNTAQYLGTTDPAGTIITDDMIRGAMMYVEEIALVMVPHKWQNLWVESYVETDIHRECSGTPDAFFFDHVTNTLHIWDFKYGFGDVDAFENEQLLCYYSGACQVYMIDGRSDQKLNVQMMVVQPRCYTSNGPIKVWDVIGSDLRGHVNQLRSAAVAAVDPNAKTKSGNHCRYCPARYACESSRQQALDGVTYCNTVAPTPLTDDGLAVELATLQNAIKDLKYREDALQEEAGARIAAGKRIPNFSRQPIMGHRKFDADVDVVNIIGQMQGISLIKDPELVTPAEAERRLRTSGMKPKDIEVALTGLVTRPTSGTRVVMDKGVDARRIFSKPI